MTKNFIWNAIGTTINSFLSLFLLIIVTRCNGIEISGTFSFLFTISLILQVVSNYGGRIYQTSDIKGEFTFNEYLSSRLYTSIITIILFFIVCAIYKFNTNVILTGLMLLLLRIIESVSDVIYGSLQKDNKLDIVGKSLVLKSVSILVVFSIINLITKNLLYSTIGLLVAALIIFIVYDLKRINNFKFKNNFKIYTNTFIIFIFGFITLLTINIPRFVSEYTLNDKELGYLGILLMIPTVMGLVCNFLLQPQIVVLSKFYFEKKLIELKKEYRKVNLMIVIISIVCIICAILLGNFILSLLYGIPFDEYKIGFCILILCGTLNGISVVYSNVLTIMRKTKVQLIPFIISLIIIPVLVYFLSNSFGLYGVFYSLLIIMLIQTIIFIIITRICIRKAFK